MAKNPQSAPSHKKLMRAFDEIAKKPPAILAQTARREGAKAANAQRVAIAFSKARKHK